MIVPARRSMIGHIGHKQGEARMGETQSRSVMDRRIFMSLTAGTAALALARPGWAKAKSLELTALTLHEVSDLVRNKEVSPVELTRACLARIEKYDSKVNAFISV